MAAVRFVNLSAENLNLRCYVGTGTSPVDSNRSYPSAGGFASVTPGNYSLLVQDPTQPTKIAQLAGYSFSSGRAYTVMLTGTTSGTGDNALKLTVLQNN